MSELVKHVEEVRRELLGGRAASGGAFSLACPAGDPCPATGCPACCPSYDPCGEKNCRSCNPKEGDMHVPEEANLAKPQFLISGRGDNSLLICSDEECGWHREFPIGEPVESFLTAMAIHKCKEETMHVPEEAEPINNPTPNPSYSKPTVEEILSTVKKDFAKSVMDYPYADGDVLVLAPGLFWDPIGEVISWEGENYSLAKGDEDKSGYPFKDTDGCTVLGPETYVTADGKSVVWDGQWFLSERVSDSERAREAIKRQDHERQRLEALDRAITLISNKGPASNPEFLREETVKAAEKFFSWLIEK